MADTQAPRRIVVAAVVDVVAVVLFVVLGRSSHHESGSAITGTLKVVAPFLLAVALGWLAARAWRSPMSPTVGIVIWLVTAAGGMFLRRVVFQRSTALAFVIVGSVFTLLFLVGWRLVVEWLTERRRKV